LPGRVIVSAQSIFVVQFLKCVIQGAICIGEHEAFGVANRIDHQFNSQRRNRDRSY